MLPAGSDSKADLQASLMSLVEDVFGRVESRWIDAEFPFTTPSFELEIKFRGEWLEVLGCGCVHPDVLHRSNLPRDAPAWAFGLGLERLAMVLFNIPDIRLFWSQDPRFLGQFSPGVITPFAAYSKFPACYKDFSFWVVDGPKYSENDLHEIVRGVAGDLVESLEEKDRFVAKDGRTSLCFRVSYQSMERNLVNAEIDAMQQEIRDRIAKELKGIIALR